MSGYSALVRHFTYPLIQRRDGLKNLYRNLHEYEQTQWRSRDEIEQIQVRRLRALMEHAWRNTTYYREVLTRAGMQPEDFRRLTDLESLPILTKEIIRNRLPDLKASNIDERRISYSETGGTTGVKMRFCLDKRCLSPKAAATIRQERWAGWDIGETRGLVWPAQQDYVGHFTAKAKLRNALSKREVVLPAAVLDSAKIEAFIAQCRRRRPLILLGFSTPLYLVAGYVLKTPGLEISIPSAISTGEPLYRHQRKVIEEAFQCEVFDSYRTREVGLVAQECCEHDGMHINAENLHIETLEDKASGTTKLLVTDLTNFGMPFIRYEIGDAASLSDRKCECGRGLPILDMGIGRAADVMYTPEGSVISAVTLVLYLVDNGPPVGQVQVIQDRIDHLLVRLTKDPLPGKELYDHYTREVARLFGETVRVDFDLVDSIESEPSGKYRFAVCAIPEKDRPGEFRVGAETSAENEEQSDQASVDT